MEMLQLREKEVFETLKKIKGFEFVVIGGYAINCYVLPRFSVDCDIVVKDIKEAEKISRILEKMGYVKEASFMTNLSYHAEFIRYEKSIEKNFRLSMDIMIGHVLDRKTTATFSADWVFDNSQPRLLRGKTITEQLKLRVLDADALFAMKFVTERTSDIRDIFMLVLKIKDSKWIKDEISDRYHFKSLADKIKEKVTSPKFKDNLQGVFGYIDNKLFEKHKEKLLEVLESNT